MFDGHLLTKAVQARPIAGNFVVHQAERRLAQLGIPITPQYLVAGKQAVVAGQPPVYTRRAEREAAVTPSYHQMAVEVGG